MIYRLGEKCPGQSGMASVGEDWAGGSMGVRLLISIIVLILLLAMVAVSWAWVDMDKDSDGDGLR